MLELNSSLPFSVPIPLSSSSSWTPGLFPLFFSSAPFVGRTSSFLAFLVLVMVPRESGTDAFPDQTQPCFQKTCYVEGEDQRRTSPTFLSLCTLFCSSFGGSRYFLSKGPLLYSYVDPHNFDTHIDSCFPSILINKSIRFP